VSFDEQRECFFSSLTKHFLIHKLCHYLSSRNPGQVFMLLEVLYSAFDKIASQRKVFKVETIGDCYVAATGLVSEHIINNHIVIGIVFYSYVFVSKSFDRIRQPDPMQNHAVVMARFAFDCLKTTADLTTQLTSTLGIETADLKLRIGLNSGPTTAGGKSASIQC
jgi:class 3 adenylate cyclase